MKIEITNTTKKVIICSLVFSFLNFTTLQGQESIKVSSLTIEQCYEWSKENYPITQQMEIIDKTKEYNISNASKGYLPQISLNGQATYQSDVIQFPFEMPGITFPTIDKDQYKTYVNVYQSLSNFGIVNNQKKIEETNGEIEKQKIELEFLKLKDRINQIFFGLILITEKNKQLNIVQVDIDSALVRVDAAIVNGTATINDKQLLQVEKISLDQQINENTANQSAFVKMISTMTGHNITTNTQLIQPPVESHNYELHRPELKLFSLQNQTLSLEKKILNNSQIPNIGLFGQGGYSKPALNLLSNDFAFYYIGGIKLSWNVSGLYNLNKRKQLLRLANETIEAQKQSFLLNTNLTQSQQSAEVEKYQFLILTDKQIITIRQNVLNTARAQLENGLITTIDYINILNDLKQATQTMLLHETQLLLAQQNLKNTTGN